MADSYKKISDFQETSNFLDNDLLLVSQSGTTKVIKGSTLKSFATAAGINAAKINNAYVDSNGHLILITTDETQIDTGRVTGSNGVSVTDASINSNYHLILTFSDGSSVDAGYCRGASGSGSGDMLAADYDPSGLVSSAGGIQAYVDGSIPPVVNDLTSTSTTSAASAASVKMVYDLVNRYSSSQSWTISPSNFFTSDSTITNESMPTSIELKNSNCYKQSDEFQQIFGNFSLQCKYPADSNRSVFYLFLRNFPDGWLDDIHICIVSATEISVGSSVIKCFVNAYKTSLPTYGGTGIMFRCYPFELFPHSASDIFNIYLNFMLA